MLVSVQHKRLRRPRTPFEPRPRGAIAILSAHGRRMVAELEGGKKIRLTVLFDREGKVTEDPVFGTKARAVSPGRDWEVDLVWMWAVPLPSPSEGVYH